MTIQYYSRKVYGNTLFYPANKEAQIAALLIRQKTLNEGAMKLLTQLGHTIERVEDPEGVATF